jgi:ribosomal protein L22
MEVEVSTSQNKVSIKKLKELRDTITELEVCEQAEILKIVEKNRAKFTENKNGVFINMNKLSDKAIEDIETFLEYIQNNYKKNLI